VTKETLIVSLKTAELGGQARNLTEPRWVRLGLTTVALLFIALFLLVPLAQVFTSALDKGVVYYFDAIRDPEALSAIRLTLLTAFFSVLFNSIFGLASAWAITKFRFPGKNLLITLIDLPFTVSPVVSGLIYVLLFGLQGLWGHWLKDHNIQIIFAAPGIILATLFVTFPFVSRELIPLMQEQGSEEEEAAMVLGATATQMFWRVTLPNIQWGLLYGIILCNARAMGEFGAVSVVSGHIRGLTNTLPLHVEILYNDYNFTAAFAVASLLTFLAILTLIAKSIVSARYEREKDVIPTALESEPA
jgi:sulfate/thiosulfate transport system permease protein